MKQVTIKNARKIFEKYGIYEIEVSYTTVGIGRYARHIWRIYTKTIPTEFTKLKYELGGITELNYDYRYDKSHDEYTIYYETNITSGELQHL